jgi:hypothetical protein
MSARSNGWIENYDCYRETGQLRILRQNPNLIVFLLPGSYHSLSLEENHPRIIKRDNGQSFSLFLKPLEFFYC